MKTIKVRYQVQFESTIKVANNATPEDIGEIVSQIEIPEDDAEIGGSKYVQNSFEPTENRDEDS